MKRYVKAPQIAYQDVRAGIASDTDLDEQIAIFEAAVQASGDLNDTGSFVTPQSYLDELDARTEVANKRARREYDYARRNFKQKIGNTTVYLEDRLPEAEIHAKPLNEYTLSGFQRHADALLSRTMETGSTDRWITYQANYIKGFDALLDQYSASGGGQVSKQEVAEAIKKGLMQLDPATFRRAYYSRTAGDIDYLQSDEAQSLKDENIESKFQIINNMFDLGVYDKNGNVDTARVRQLLGG